MPFVRPDHLASDTATTNDVIVHALNFYADKGINYDTVVLLQPTSPLRTAAQVREAMDLYSSELDMVVSVKESAASVVLFKENERGYMEHAFDVSGGVHYGGVNTTGEVLQDIRRYDPQKDEWTYIAVLNEGLMNHVSFAIGKRVYIGLGENQDEQINDKLYYFEE